MGATDCSPGLLDSAQNHLSLLESSDVLNLLQQGLMYLVKLSEVDDEEMFKVRPRKFF